MTFPSTIETSTVSSTQVTESNLYTTHSHSQTNQSFSSTSSITETSQSMYITDSPDESSTTESLISDTDRCEREGFMANTENCKKYYRCVSSGNGTYIRFEFMCGEGTAWDQQLLTCNYEYQVESCNNGK
jgi:collagen type IV alpha